MPSTDDLCHDAITERVYRKQNILYPKDSARLEIALNHMIGQHHSGACMARLKRDTKLAAYHDKEYEEYCNLFEIIMGKSPFAGEKEEDNA